MQSKWRPLRMRRRSNGPRSASQSRKMKKWKAESPRMLLLFPVLYVIHRLGEGMRKPTHYLFTLHYITLHYIRLHYIKSFFLLTWHCNYLFIYLFNYYNVPTTIRYLLFVCFLYCLLYMLLVLMNISTIQISVLIGASVSEPPP